MTKSITLHSKRFHLPDEIALKGITFPDVIVSAATDEQACSEFLEGVLSSMIADLAQFSTALSLNPSEDTVEKYVSILYTHGFFFKGDIALYHDAVPIKYTPTITSLLAVYATRAKSLIWQASKIRSMHGFSSLYDFHEHTTNTPLERPNFFLKTIVSQNN